MDTPRQEFAPADGLVTVLTNLDELIANENDEDLIISDIVTLCLNHYRQNNILMLEIKNIWQDVARIGIPFGTGILTTIILAIIVEKAGYASINIGRQTSPFEALKGPASAIALELLKYGKDNISTEDIIGVITHKLPK